MENIEALSPIIFQHMISSHGNTLQLIPIPAVAIGPGPGPGGGFYHFNLLLMLSYIVNTETGGAQGSGNINSGPAVVRRPSSQLRYLYSMF